MKKRKKKNNIDFKKGNYYYRVRWYNEFGRQIETTVPLHSKTKGEALHRGKIVEKNEDNIKDGTIQAFQFKNYFPWLNNEGSSILIKKSLQNTINEYLKYRSHMVKSSTIKRDKSALNQLKRFIGLNMPVEELSHKNIEGANGLIQHLRTRGCSDVGINTSLRHIRTYFNWLYEKEKILSERIKINEIKKGQQLYHYINESEIFQVYNYIDKHLDSFFKRTFYFYEKTGMRPTEPFIGDLVGDWYIINGDDRKNGIPMQMKLNEELKTILLEMQSFRDTKLHCKDANERVTNILSTTMLKIVREIGFMGKKLTMEIKSGV